MPRRERLGFPGAIYYVRLRGRPGASIFFDASILQLPRVNPRALAPDVHRFESILKEVCEQCAARVYAYELQPNSGSLVLQISCTPADTLMRRLCGEYSRYLHSRGRIVEGQPVFARRYESRIVAPAYLMHAIRRVHRSPVESGLCRQRIDYPFSSERAYMGEAPALPLAIREVREVLAQRAHPGVRGYREFMDREESDFVARLFARGAPQDSRIVGDGVFVAQALNRARQPLGAPTRDQLIQGVARLIGCAPEDLRSATHAGVLGRALVAWYAMRTGAATLAEVGRWFSVTGATLRAGIHHYHRSGTRQLFDQPVKFFLKKEEDAGA